MLSSRHLDDLESAVSLTLLIVKIMVKVDRGYGQIVMQNRKLMVRKDNCWHLG